jgi:Tol biopolymer transport system component
MNRYGILISIMVFHAAIFSACQTAAVPSPTQTDVGDPSATSTIDDDVVTESYSPTPQIFLPSLETGLYIIYHVDEQSYLRTIEEDLKLQWPFLGDLSSDNAYSVYAEGGQLNRMNISSGQANPIDLGDSVFLDIYRPEWSPDDRFIAFAGTSISIDGEQAVVEEFPSIFILDLQLNQTVRVTDWDTVEIFPVWSPDGLKIVFASDILKVEAFGPQFIGETDLFISTDPFNKHGESKAESLTDYGITGKAGMPSWSPNGDQLVFRCGLRDIEANSGTESYQDDICILDLPTMNIQNITNTIYSDEMGPVWSPNGSYIGFSQQTYAEDSSVNYDLILYSIDSERSTNITNSPDKDEFFSAWLVWP